MPIRWQKKLWLGLLLMSAGGTLALIVLSVAEGVPPPIWFVWPPLTALATWALRNCYRREPSDLRGFWHLRIEDLAVAAIYAGLLLAALKPLLGPLFNQIGFIFAIVNAIAFIIGCLSAQRNGHTTPVEKLLFAFTYGTRLVGLVAGGTALAIVIMDGIYFGAPFTWLEFVLRTEVDSFMRGSMLGWLVLHRMTLGCLPAGVALSWVAGRSLRRKTALTEPIHRESAAPLIESQPSHT